MVGAAAVRLRGRGARVAYTRKVFHFGIFTLAALVHGRAGLGATNAFGAAVALVVLWATARGERSRLFGALARDKDAPRRAAFVVIPLVTTAVGGLASALAAGPFASVGFLVGGWGDAVGEPVGARWGKHPYRVPSLFGVAAQRSVEGSVAVLAAGWAGATLALWPMAGPAGAITVGLACAVVGAAVEAVSHHGLDNLTVQVAATLTALWLAG